MILWDRTYSLLVGDTDVTGLRVQFTAKKTLKAEPNSCNIKIYNLSNDTRKKIEGTKEGIPVSLHAGYRDRMSQIYFGQVTAVQTTVDGPDRITEISTGDGAKAIAQARISVPIGPKQNAGAALDALAKALGVGAGNLAEAKGKLASKGIAYFSPRGTVLSGNVARELTDFCESADLEWSVQDGKLQILDKGKALDGQAVSISSSTGLTDSPTVDGKGIVSFTCLIIPELRPGRKVSLETEFFKGGFRLTETEHHGDTYGKDWHIKCKAEKY